LSVFFSSSFLSLFIRYPCESFNLFSDFFTQTANKVSLRFYRVILPLQIRSGVGSQRPPGHMWPVAWFSVACGSIQEKLQIWNFLQLITVNVSVEANLNRDVLLFPLEGTALS